MIFASTFALLVSLRFHISVNKYRLLRNISTLVFDVHFFIFSEGSSVFLYYNNKVVVTCLLLIYFIFFASLPMPSESFKTHIPRRCLCPLSLYFMIFYSLRYLSNRKIYSLWKQIFWKTNFSFLLTIYYKTWRYWSTAIQFNFIPLPFVAKNGYTIFILLWNMIV